MHVKYNTTRLIKAKQTRNEKKYKLHNFSRLCTLSTAAKLMYE